MRRKPNQHFEKSINQIKSIALRKIKLNFPILDSMVALVTVGVEEPTGEEGTRATMDQEDLALASSCQLSQRSNMK